MGIYGKLCTKLHKNAGIIIPKQENNAVLTEIALNWEAENMNTIALAVGL